ncbi:guanylate kinase [Candidatus Mycoplasma haematobovis]|uniref:Guanylate kinase n=1 Tax=Candidatus Mycoplasma haematobovis TaxID=432608 RepID=A0A1A9QFI6_9MOLU|nr:guanylate kinase [Candidatus Mycoplasma haematobovis]OAL10735.1 guanylate kinase [Candidatus Mycoplasma haematobovis]
MLSKGRLFIISGSSGVGKRAIIEKLLANPRLNLVFSVSYTTRAKRFNEVHGVHYFFISKEEFIQNIESGKMLEYANFFGNYYGTSKEWVDNTLNEGKNVILEIETLGFKQILEKCDDFVSIFIEAPSMEELERRLRKRGTESEEDIKIRLLKAEKEILVAPLFKYRVVNDVLEDAIKEVENIFLKAINQ